MRALYRSLTGEEKPQLEGETLSLPITMCFYITGYKLWIVRLKESSQPLRPNEIPEKSFLHKLLQRKTQEGRCFSAGWELLVIPPGELDQVGEGELGLSPLATAPATLPIIC